MIVQEIRISVFVLLRALEGLQYYRFATSGCKAIRNSWGYHLHPFSEKYYETFLHCISMGKLEYENSTWRDGVFHI